MPLTHGRLPNPLSGPSVNMDSVQAQVFTKDWLTCAKISNCDFLFLDACNLRLLTLRELAPEASKSHPHTLVLYRINTLRFQVVALLVQFHQSTPSNLTTIFLHLCLSIQAFFILFWPKSGFQDRDTWDEMWHQPSLKGKRFYRRGKDLWEPFWKLFIKQGSMAS